MSLWTILATVFIAGGAGGVVNAILSHNGFFLPKTVSIEKRKIWRPGILGNVLVSGMAACISWGLYGPFAAAYLVGGPKSSVEGTTTTATSMEVGLTLSAFVGAILVGVAGARWLTNEVDKLMLRGAASEAASSQSNPDMAARIAIAPPAEALEIAQK